jgi:hypothetical protein
MSNLAYKNNPNDVCFYCSHTYSVHFLHDKHVLESNEISDTTSGCRYVKSDGLTCICPGFRSANTNYNNQ